MAGGHLLTYITALVGIVINLLIVAAVVRRRKSIKGWGYLVVWLLSLAIIMQLIGSMIIYFSDEKIALFLYQLISVFIGIFVLFYYFANSYLAKPKKHWFYYSGFVFVVLLVSAYFIVPDFIVNSVTYDTGVGFYLADGTIIGRVLAFIGVLYWLVGIYQVYSRYRSSTSAVERNQLKYLIIGGLAPLLGLVLIAIPLDVVRRYPFDMWGVTVGSIALAYGILRYKLLDISVVVSKGLVYAVLSAFITLVYLITLFVLSQFLGYETDTTALPVTIVTAFIVAIVFQPLQEFTQRGIERILVYKNYNPQNLLAEYSEAMTGNVDFFLLAQSILRVIATNLQINSAVLIARGGGMVDWRVVQYGKGDDTSAASDHDLIAHVDKLAILQQQVASIDDVFDPEIKEVMNKSEVELLIPLSIQSQFIGVIGLSAKSTGMTYSLFDYRLLAILGDQGAVAIKNALLFEEIKEEKSKVQVLLDHEREVDAMKSEFINIASHNLRTPLTTIIGYADTLMDEKQGLGVDAHPYLERLRAAAKQLSGLVEQLLIVASLEKGELALNKESIDLVGEVRDMVDDLSSVANEKGITVKIDGDGVGSVVADRLKIRLVVQNLLENAIKYTDQGSIEIAVTSQNGKVELAVKDTGIGVPPEEIANLFAKFHQIHEGLNATRGIGLGLYLSKLIIKAHGGEIDAESEVGKGSKFSFWLPKDRAGVS